MVHQPLMLTLRGCAGVDRGLRSLLNTALCCDLSLKECGPTAFSTRCHTFGLTAGCAGFLLPLLLPLCLRVSPAGGLVAAKPGFACGCTKPGLVARAYTKPGLGACVWTRCSLLAERLTYPAACCVADTLPAGAWPGGGLVVSGCCICGLWRGGACVTAGMCAAGGRLCAVAGPPGTEEPELWSALGS